MTTKAPKLPDLNPSDPHAGNIFDRINAAAKDIRRERILRTNEEAELRRQALARAWAAEQKRAVEEERATMAREAAGRARWMTTPLLGDLPAIGADPVDDPLEHADPESEPQ